MASWFPTINGLDRKGTNRTSSLNTAQRVVLLVMGSRRKLADSIAGQGPMRVQPETLFE